MVNEIKISLKGLDCANCANKIEVRVNELEDIKEVSLNFSLARMTLSIKDGINKEDLINKIKKIVNDLEPHVVVSEYKVNKMRIVNNTDVLNQHSHINKEEKPNDKECCSLEGNTGDKHSHNNNIIGKESDEHVHVHEIKDGGILKQNISLIIGIIIYFIGIILEDKGSISIILFFIS